MRNLNTIQKIKKINDVFSIDMPNEETNACHVYVIAPKTDVKLPIMTCEKDHSIHAINASENQADLLNDCTFICFQIGVRNEKDSITGVLDTDLLEIVRDRLKGFQNGEFHCRENALALTHIEEALLWLNQRTMDRYKENCNKCGGKEI